MSHASPFDAMSMGPYRAASDDSSAVTEELRTVTPIHASPFSTSRAPTIPHDASLSRPALVLKGSTTTRPLPAFCEAGARTRMRVVYGSRSPAGAAGPAEVPE